MYLLKVNNKNIETRCKICSKLAIKTPERRQNFWETNTYPLIRTRMLFWRRSGVFTNNSEQILHLVLLFLLLTLSKQIPAGKDLQEEIGELQNGVKKSWVKLSSFSNSRDTSDEGKWIRGNLIAISFIKTPPYDFCFESLM